MSLEATLPWITSFVGMSVMWLAGKGHTRRWAWILGILNQAAWISYAVAAHAYGFIAGSLVYAAVYTRNLLKGD